MIISCPACATRYVVPETAIGSEGRTVRCAKCKHSWHQDPPPLDLVEQASAEEAGNAAKEQDEPSQSTPAPTPATPPPAPPPPPSSSEAPGPSISHWRTGEHPASTGSATASDATGEGIAARVLRQGTIQDPNDAAPLSSSADELQDTLADAFDPDADPLAGQGAGANQTGDDADYDFDEDYDPGEGSHFDYSPPFTRRRNSLKMWTIAAAVFALLASGTVVAVNYYGLPDWFPVARPTFGIGKADLELDFPAAQQRKEVLESGEEIFRVRGSINNIGQTSVNVPALLIVFRDERKKNVYSWVVVPSKRELAPGESLNVTEAVTNIPASAKSAEIGWSPN
ncbi:zinc-ribbon domain-containing protein [Qipengyuania sp. ASV99]|uniref:zinc-ribbon domain-containing protein n=1 Tax=Qipengyuania sp. ASV99 TaxID=3399681 RepID=UPI003A4C6278